MLIPTAHARRQTLSVSRSPANWSLSLVLLVTSATGDCGDTLVLVLVPMVPIVPRLVVTLFLVEG